jgi:predicted transcriptional regulator
MVQVGFRLEASLVKRLDEIASMLASKTPGQVNRTDIVRAALALGLEKMDKAGLRQ